MCVCMYTQLYTAVAILAACRLVLGILLGDGHSRSRVTGQLTAAASAASVAGGNDIDVIVRATIFYSR